MRKERYREEEGEEIYEDIDEVITGTKGIIMRDWNARLGRERGNSICGGYGLKDKNERGTILIELCKEYTPRLKMFFNSYLSTSFLPIDECILISWQDNIRT